MSRVNDLYFGILLLDEQLRQNALLQDELGRNYRQITAYVENGIANQADLDAVKVEQLNTQQKRVELASFARCVSGDAFHIDRRGIISGNTTGETGSAK